MALLTGLFILYFLLLILMLAGWKMAMSRPVEEVTSKEPLISVIIPVRNEEMRIGTLLKDLSVQEYKNFEIIVVNDDSEDETLWMVSRYELKNLNVVHNKGKGKKAAITTGIAAARGSIVVTTDADCSVRPQWLKYIRAPFREQKVMMVFGGVRMQGEKRFFDSLQSMEFSSLIGSGASTAALGFPTMCNGANLAFRRNVFSELKGYQDNLDIPSGDDEFLMRKIHKRYPKGVRFINHPDAIVTTGTQDNPEAFLNQRIRWASKWKYNSSRITQAVAVAVVLFQLTFLVNWVLVFTPYILQSFFFIAIKMILEAAVLLQVCRFLSARWNWLAFFTLQVIYPFYVIGVAITSFFRPFEWKHRIYKPEKGVSR
jgi:poly-beta-1,6-N-acetyl-D-glucosamine synthase